MRVRHWTLPSASKYPSDVAGHVVASVTFGALWSHLGPARAIQLFAVGLTASILIGGRLLLRRSSATT